MSHAPNFLEAQGAPVYGLRPRRWPIILIVVIIISGALTLLLAKPVNGILRAWDLVSRGRISLVRAENLGVSFDFSGANTAFEEALADFSAAEAELARADILKNIPWVGTQIRAVSGLLDTGIETISAAREILSFGSEMRNVISEAETAQTPFVPNISPSATFSSLSSDDKRRILEQFVMSAPRLEAASGRIDAALEKFSQIPDRGVTGSLARAIRPVGEALPRIRDDLNRLIPLAKILPTLAGYPNPKDILILFLNNAELRPGGGFIGTVGRLVASDASVLGLETRDSYSIDGPAESFLNAVPPTPLRQYLGLNRWFMRDSNWSPDFKISSQNVIDFYERETNNDARTNEIDIVIGFTPSFASEILRVTGPVSVQDFTFDAGNLFEILEYQVEQGFTERDVPFTERKEILVRLVDATVAKLFTLPASKWEEMLAVIDRGFKEKQLMIYDSDPVTEALLDGENWAGSVDTGSGDFFMVVDANLGSLKSDPSVRRFVNYAIEPDGDTYRATLQITYRHEGHFDWKTTRYRTYTRLYVPLDSEFLSASGALKDDKLKNPRREAGVVDVMNATDLQGGEGRRAKVFGAFISIEPGEERTLTFNYRLSQQTARSIASASCYNLKVGKQLGAFAHELTLNLDFGKTVKNANPPEELVNFGDDRYSLRTNLAEDREFEICF